jgi:hypothetical protein
MSTEFTAEIRKLISHALEAAAKEIAAKYGCEAAYSGGRYGTDSYTAKIEFTEPTRKSATATSMASALGLPADIIGYSFRSSTKTFTVVGLNPSRPKFCVALKDENGKSFKCSVAQLKFSMSGK